MAQSQTTLDTNTPTPKRKKRRLLKVFIVLLGAFVIVGACIPMLLGGPFKGMVVSQINNQINGTATLDSLSLTWFGGQKIQGLKIVDAANQTVLDIATLDLPDISLFALATGGRDFGDLTIHITALNVQQHADGSNNLQNLAKVSDVDTQEASGGAAKETVEKTSGGGGVTSVSQMIPMQVSAVIHLIVDQLSLVAPDQTQTTLDDIKMDMTIKGGRPIVGKLTSNVTHGPLHGSVVSNLNIDSFADFSDTQITLDVTPQAWAQFATTSKAKLLEPFGVSLNIRRLKIPALAGALGLDELSADISLALTDVQLQPEDQQLGTLKLSGANLQIYAEGGALPVIVAIKGQVTQSGQLGTFDLNINLKNLLSELAKPTPDFSAVTTSMVGDVKNVGMVIFDEILQTNGLIRNAIGPTLTANINSQMRYDSSGVPQGNLNFKATSLYLNADLSVNMGPNGISQKSPGKLIMQITPALYASALKVPAGEPIPLAESFTAELQLNQLNIPRVDNQWQIQTASLDLLLSLGDILLKGQADQRVTLAKPTWQVRSQAVGKQIDIRGGFDASQQGGKPGRFSLTASASDLFDARGQLRNDKASFKANITLLPWQLPQLIPGLKFNLNSLVNQIVGSKQTIDLVGKMLPATAGEPEPSIPNMALKFTTKSFAINTDIKAVITDDLIVLDPLSTLEVRLTPELVKLLTATGPTAEGEPASKPIGLALPVTLKGQLTTLAWPLRSDQQSKARIALTLTADRIEPAGLPGGLSASLRDMSLTLGQGNPFVKLPVVLKGDLYEKDTLAGNLDLSLSLLSLLTTPSAENLQVSMTNVPVSLVDSLAGLQGKLYALLGQRLDSITLNTTGPLDQDMQVSVKVKSQRLNLAVDAQVTADAVTVESGSEIKLKITPASLNAVMVAVNPELIKNPPMWVLLSPAELNFSVDKAFLPIAAANLSKTQMGLTFTATDLDFVQRELKTPLKVSGLKVNLDAPKLSSPITVALSANMFSKDAQGQVSQSPFVSKTVVTDLVNKQGKIDAINAVVKTQTVIPKLPVALIDQLMQQDGKLAGIIGPTAEIKVVGGYPGDLDLSVKGEFASLVLPATIDANRVLTLRENAVVMLAVTPQTAKTLLKYGNPILIDATSSREPVKVTVYAKGFSMPLADFDLKKVSANMAVELGTITLSDSWLLNSISEDLGKLDRAMSVSQKQDAKFSKLMVSLHEGVTKTNDLWLQIDNVSLFGKSRLDTLTLGTQGSVDLNASTVDMGLALPAQTLYSFGQTLRKYIKPETIFEMSLNGPLDNVQLKGLDKLAIQLVAMVGVGELAGENLGVWGALLGQVAGNALGGGDVKNFESKRTWPNKPVIKEPQPQPVTQGNNTQQQAQPQQVQPIEQLKKKEKNDTEKALDLLQGLFR